MAEPNSASEQVWISLPPSLLEPTPLRRLQCRWFNLVCRLGRGHKWVPVSAPSQVCNHCGYRRKKTPIGGGGATS